MGDLGCLTERPHESAFPLLASTNIGASESLLESVSLSDPDELLELVESSTVERGAVCIKDIGLNSAGPIFLIWAPDRLIELKEFVGD
jgi:hypothetical protein